MRIEKSQFDEWALCIGHVMILFAEIEWEIDNLVELIVKEKPGWKLSRRVDAVIKAARDLDNTLGAAIIHTCDEVLDAAQYRNIVAHEALRFKVSRETSPRGWRFRDPYPQPRITITGYQKGNEAYTLEFFRDNLTPRAHRVCDELRQHVEAIEPDKTEG